MSQSSTQKAWKYAIPIALIISLVFGYFLCSKNIPTSQQLPDDETPPITDVMEGSELVPQLDENDATNLNEQMIEEEIKANEQSVHTFEANSNLEEFSGDSGSMPEEIELPTPDDNWQNQGNDNWQPSLDEDTFVDPSSDEQD